MTDSGCRWRSREGGARTANLVRTFPYSAPSCRERLSERQLEGFSIVGPWLRKPQRRGQGTPFCRLTGLQFGAYPDFSDSLRRCVLGSPYTGSWIPPSQNIANFGLWRRPKLMASPPHLGARKMRCDVGSCGPPRSGQGVYEALINSTRAVLPSVRRARNLSSGVFVDWQRYGQAIFTLDVLR
jgi:hypothetical protein